MVDDDHQPDYAARSSLEAVMKDRMAAIVRPRVLDPKEEKQDDDEVEEFLGLDPSTERAQGSSWTEAGPSSQPLLVTRDEEVEAASSSSPAPSRRNSFIKGQGKARDLDLVSGQNVNGDEQAQEGPDELPELTEINGASIGSNQSSLSQVIKASSPSPGPLTNGHLEDDSMQQDEPSASPAHSPSEVKDLNMESFEPVQPLASATFPADDRLADSQPMNEHGHSSESANHDEDPGLAASHEPKPPASDEVAAALPTSPDGLNGADSSKDRVNDSAGAAAESRHGFMYPPIPYPAKLSHQEATESILYPSLTSLVKGHVEPGASMPIEPVHEPAEEQAVDEKPEAEEQNPDALVENWEALGAETDGSDAQDDEPPQDVDASDDEIMIPRAGTAAYDSDENVPVATLTTELGEEEDVVEASTSRNTEEESCGHAEAVDGIQQESQINEPLEQSSSKDAEITTAADNVADSAAGVEVIDFTGEDSSDDDEEILIPRVAQPPAPPTYVTTPSNELLRGPLAGSTRESDAGAIIQAMGRASLISPPRSDIGSSRSVMSQIFDQQRYERPRAKRPHILEDVHQCRVRRKNIGEFAALRQVARLSTAVLKKHGFASQEDYSSWARYKQHVSKLERSRNQQVISSPTSTRDKTNSVQELNKMQDRLRQLLNKSSASESRIKVKPGKEQRRLQREALEKERHRRGILGRQPLPSRLAPEQEAAVDDILRNPQWKVSIPGAAAENRDIVKLKPGQWLNDETIAFYMTMLNIRSNEAEAKRAQGADKAEPRWRSYYRVHCFNTFFWTRFESDAGYSAVARWTRKVNIFEKDLVLIPINEGQSHWTCAAINFRRKRFEYYDSMGKRDRWVASKLRSYLKKEMIDKKKEGIVDLNE